jgi:electron transfer flavoprotein beta subunit
MLIVAALGGVESLSGVEALSADDECALEHALRLTESLGGECLAAGPSDVVLRQALAAGVHTALRVDLPEQPFDDGSGVAAALAEAVMSRHPGLVLCGTGATAAFLAARLDAQQALGVLSIEASADGKLLVERRLDGGRRERLSVTTPAVISVEPTDVRLRRASLPSLLASRKAEIDVVTPSSSTVETRVRVGTTQRFSPRTRRVPAPVGTEPHARLLALTGALAEHDPPRLVHPPDAKSAAAELLTFLRQHGYLE